MTWLWILKMFLLESRHTKENLRRLLTDFLRWKPCKLLHLAWKGSVIQIYFDCPKKSSKQFLWSNSKTIVFLWNHAWHVWNKTSQDFCYQVAKIEWFRDHQLMIRLSFGLFMVANWSQWVFWNKYKVFMWLLIQFVTLLNTLENIRQMLAMYLSKKFLFELGKVHKSAYYCDEK